MNDFVRILFAELPKTIEKWLSHREHTDWVSNGIMGENFKVLDLLFEHPEDAVQFKLTFPDIVMTHEEVKICDAKQTWPVNLSAAKAHLYEKYAQEYEKMWRLERE